MPNEWDYIKLGLTCADVCEALDRGINGKKPDDISQAVYEVIDQLIAWVILVMRSLDCSLTMLLITELWQTSKKRSSSRADGM